MPCIRQIYPSARETNVSVGYFPVEARGAELVPSSAHRLHQTVVGEVRQRIRVDELANLFDTPVGGDELRRPRRVDAVVAGAGGRRRGDAKVHLRRARRANEPDDLLARGPAHERIVDHHHARPPQHFGLGVQFDLHAEVANALARLNEGAADVVVADDAEFEGQPARAGVADRGWESTVGHGHHQVGVDRVLAREDLAHAFPRFVDAQSEDLTVRPREVHVLEHALGQSAAPDPARGRS